jgi:hypothetical protein
MSIPATVTLATNRQKSLLLQMQEERGLPVGVKADLSSAEFEEMFAALKAMPKDAGVVSPTKGQDVPVPDGKYAIVRTQEFAELPGTSEIVFVKVDSPTQGRWKGYTFVKILSGGDNEIPVKDRITRTAILRALGANLLGAAQLYGKHIGKCSFCGTRLTDEDSITVGVGPDCFKKHFGRSRTKADVAEAAEGQIQTALLTSDLALVQAEAAAGVVPSTREERAARRRREREADYIARRDEIKTARERAAERRSAERDEAAFIKASGELADRMRERIYGRFREGRLDVSLITEGVNASEHLTASDKARLLRTANELAEQAFGATQEHVDTVERQIAAARARGDLDWALQLSEDPHYIAAQRAKFGF